MAHDIYPDPSVVIGVVNGTEVRQGGPTAMVKDEITTQYLPRGSHLMIRHVLRPIGLLLSPNTAQSHEYDNPEKSAYQKPLHVLRE